MHTFLALAKQYEEKFAVRHFSNEPATLYDAAQYILQLGGKRVRPVSVLMGNELFDEIHSDAWSVANAVELFHNFSLIHDDIMDNAPLRRGLPTVHEKYGVNTALLAGDVMFAQCYDYLAKIDLHYLQAIVKLFNRTSRQVCEGQQLDMDFEKRSDVQMDEYIGMITLKTSVLLAASLQLGAIIGGASEGNQKHLYQFGLNLGIAFQIQDDYLDAFGDPDKFGKQVGGDIVANKKTFLLLHAIEVASAEQKVAINTLLDSNGPEKVTQMLALFNACGVPAWANSLKEKYFKIALKHLDDIAVTETRKKPLHDLALFLMNREH